MRSDSSHFTRRSSSCQHASPHLTSVVRTTSCGTRHHMEARVTESGRDPEEQGHVLPVATDSTRSTRPWLARSRARYETSFVHGVTSRLVALDFTNQAILLGAGLLISLLPFLIFISAFADERIDDDLALHLGLDHHAAQIVSHLFSQGGVSFNA